MTAPQDSSSPAVPAVVAAGMTAAYLSAVKLLRSRLASTVISLFDSGSYRDTDANAYVELMGPAALATQGAMATITAAYLAHQVDPAAAVPPLDLATVTGAALRNGVDPEVLLRRPYEQVWYALSQGKTLPEAAAIGRRRALDNALTDLQLAKTRTAQQVLATNPRVIGYRRVLTGAHSCALCIVASTHTYSRGDLMPIHPQCLPGDSLIRVPSSVSSISGEVAAGQISAISRRWYSGELVILDTVNGEQMRVTSNHPVLTDQGWIPAGFISEGDRVFRSRFGHRVIGGGPQEQQAPVPVKDVWAALSVTGDLFVMPLASEDFHSDAPQGKVEVIRTNRDLASIGDTQIIQEACKLSLVTGHSRGPMFSDSGESAAFLEANCPVPGSHVSGSSLLRPLLGSHLAGAQQASTAPVTRFNAPGEQFSVQSAASYASRGLDLVRRLASHVEPDRVIKVHRVSFTGHVYNLHTREGWYESDSHIVSNCDCVVEPLLAGQTVPQLPLEQVTEAIRRDLGEQYVSPDARRGIDYRKVLVTHQHGEIGPVLSVRGQDFTGPSDIPGGSNG